MTNTDTSKSPTVTDNYLEIQHEYFSTPDEDGLRLRTRDVWFATKPSKPSYEVVDYKDQEIPGHGAAVETAWFLDKAGQSRILIIDRDDINGLRRLLDALEQDFDRRDMEALHEEVKLDTDGETE